MTSWEIFVQLSPKSTGLEKNTSGDPFVVHLVKTPFVLWLCPPDWALKSIY